MARAFRAILIRSEAAASHPELVARAQELYKAAQADGTKLTYNTGRRWYFTFCTETGVSQPFPVIEPTMCLFAAWLSDKPGRQPDGKLAPDTVKGYVFHVIALNKELGFGSPYSGFLYLKGVLKGLKRIKGGQRWFAKLPITSGILIKFYMALDLSLRYHRMLFFLLLFVWFGLARAGEAVPRDPNEQGPKLLRVEDVSFVGAFGDSDSRIDGNLKATKTDIYRQGHISMKSTGHEVLDPLKWGHLYRKDLILEGRYVARAPFFVWADGSKVTYEHLRQHIKTLAVGCGLADPSKYGGHSLRRGAATALHQKGASEEVIQWMGGWLSRCWMDYRHFTVEERASFAQRMI